MSTGASRFRPRPIDYDKPLPVVRSQNELEVNEDGVLVPKKDLIPVGMDDDENEMDTETLRVIQEQYDKESRKANIPVPPILTIEDYDKFVPRDYVRPQSYVRYKPPTDKELDERNEYEMDEQDMEFVSKTLQQQFKLVINEDKFEQILDRLEKESFKLGKMCDALVLEPYKFASGKLVNHVYEYWRKKREKLGKALIRRFQPPTSINDTSPHSTFRPREKEEKRMRRTRMKDKDAHKNLKQFHADFRRAKDLLEHLVKRERAKKALLQLEFCLKFAKDIKDVDGNLLKQQDEFFKEWYKDRDKTKQTTSKRISLAPVAEVVEEPAPGTPLAAAAAAAAAAAGRPRNATTRAVSMVEAEPVVQQVEEGDEKARRMEGMRRCFQNVMRQWDGGSESLGSSLLPIVLHQPNSFCPARMYTASTSLRNGENLQLRGRGRIGRGGRLLFDICSWHSAAPPSSPPAENPPADESDGMTDGLNGVGVGVNGVVNGAMGVGDAVLRAKRKREWLELARRAPGPDARKLGPAYIDSVWEEMRASEKVEQSSMASGEKKSCCWNFGTAAKSGYLDP